MKPGALEYQVTSRTSRLTAWRPTLAEAARELAGIAGVDLRAVALMQISETSWVAYPSEERMLARRESLGAIDAVEK